MALRAVVFGARGQLGRDLVRELRTKWEKVEVFGFGKDDVDISDIRKVKEVIFSLKPSFVFNCAAWNDVDGAEKDENSEKVFMLNSFSPFYMANFCREISAYFFNVSTDYVFDGRKRVPYVEDDEPNPLSVYALSKFLGELLVKNSFSRYVIIRSGGLYGIGGSPLSGRSYRNFPEKVIEFLSQGKTMRVVVDRFSAPTYTREIARKVVQLAQMGVERAVVHIMQKGEISWYDFACLVAKLTGLDSKLIIPVESSEFITPAERPQYSVLKNGFLEKIRSDDLMSVEDALRSYLKERGLIT